MIDDGDADGTSLETLYFYFYFYSGHVTCSSNFRNYSTMMNLMNWTTKRRRKMRRKMSFDFAFVVDVDGGCVMHLVVVVHIHHCCCCYFGCYFDLVFAWVLVVVTSHCFLREHLHWHSSSSSTSYEPTNCHSQPRQVDSSVQRIDVVQDHLEQDVFFVLFVVWMPFPRTLLLSIADGQSLTANKDRKVHRARRLSLLLLLQSDHVLWKLRTFAP
jgi:hypothetical protein